MNLGGGYFDYLNLAVGELFELGAVVSELLAEDRAATEEAQAKAEQEAEARRMRKG